jgi:polygalacturonase
MTAKFERRSMAVFLMLTAGGLALGAAKPSPRPTPRATGPFDVRAFGAKGDGQALDTEAINKAIEAAATAGGGTVLFPAGTYASHSIHLKSHIALYLDQGATIVAADPPPEGVLTGGYDAPEPNEFDRYQDFGHCHWHNSLIWGEDVEDVSILGPGRIFGRGLSRGSIRKDPLPGEPRPTRAPRTPPPPGATPRAQQEPTYGGPDARDYLPAGVGNKAIALKNCRNVTMRDFTIYHGGHFAILATGVDNMTIDNLKIDTNRDGMDIDCCRNVRVSNCSVNSPHDDGICPKSSYALGYNRPTEQLTITNCFVSGYQEGSLLDATYKRIASSPGAPTGRIKCGTESNGGFKNITISNCVFEYCRGLALESVDGAAIEDVSVTNLTMRDIVNAPIFIRLGRRLRAPENTPVGVIRRVNISDVVASGVTARQGALIVGIPNHPIEDLRLSNIRILYNGGGTKEDAALVPPEQETAYPEPANFGVLPAYGFFVRHVKGFDLHHAEVGFDKEDLRPAALFDDVETISLDAVKATHATGAPALVLRNVKGLAVHNCPGLLDMKKDSVESESF